MKVKELIKQLMLRRPDDIVYLPVLGKDNTLAEATGVWTTPPEFDRDDKPAGVMIR